MCSVSGVNGTTLSYSQAGTCVIGANQAGKAGYAAAPTVTGSVTVDQMPAFTLDTPPTVGTVARLHLHAHRDRRAHPDLLACPGGAVMADARLDDGRPLRHRQRARSTLPSAIR